MKWMITQNLKDLRDVLVSTTHVSDFCYSFVHSYQYAEGFSSTVHLL